jgi:AcrR family transcriptional regulator
MKAVATSSLLDAAEVVIAKCGPEGAKIGDIARQAGMAVGTVYKYFADRDALLAALRSDRKRQLVEALERALAGSRDERFEQRVRQFVHAMFVFGEARRPIFTLLLAARDHQRALSNSAEAAKELFALGQKLMRAGVESGALRAEHADTHAVVLFAIVRGLAANALRDPKAPLTDSVDPAVELFLHGAAKRR